MIDLLTGILATWRLTSLLHSEDGPFDVFAELRDWAGVRYDEQSRPVSDTQIGKMLACFWCCSVWGALLVGLFRGKFSIRDLLAHSAGAILLEKLVEELDAIKTT